MPEGDTVWLAARRLHRALAGETLTRSDFRVPRLATADLSGREVIEVMPRSKHLLARVSGGLTLHTHLRIDGSWRVFAPGERWRGGSTFQIRVVLATQRSVAVGYRLPVAELIRTADEAVTVGHLGPDLLGPGWDRDEALRRLLAVPECELGPALLDQRNLAGIGNMYMAELCFLAGVSPWTPVGRVPALGAVVDEAHRLLHRNIETGRQTTTGDHRSGRQHWVYGRGGQPCWRCGTPVRAAEQGEPPRVRLTYWCSTCQPLP